MAPPTSSPHPTSIDVLEFVVNQRNGLTGLLDKLTLDTLPETYVLPPHERIDESNTLIISNNKWAIPVIDVLDRNDARVEALICEAATTWGFFQIVNHGVPLEELKEAAHESFELPCEEKRRYWKGNSVSETAFFATSFCPSKETVLEWKDYLSFECKPVDKEASALWPTVCKNQVLEYIKSLEPVIKKLLETLLKKLNVHEIEKAREHEFMGSLTLEMNYYPKCPNPELAVGIARHSDMSIITVLLQDDVGGLYVRSPDAEEKWIHVPPTEGALVINIGDVLQIMSNDRYQSVEHRVVVNRSQNRISVPVFVNPRCDVRVGPLEEALESEENAVYKEITFSDYEEHYSNKEHDGKKTLDIARINTKDFCG